MCSSAHENAIYIAHLQIVDMLTFQNLQLQEEQRIYLRVGILLRTVTINLQ